MRTLFVLELLLTVFFCTTTAFANVGADLKKIAIEIQNFQEQLESEKPVTPERVKKTISSLTHIIDGKLANDKGKAVAYYYRAEARRLLNSIRYNNKQPIDLTVARATLADYDSVIAIGFDLENWNVSVAGANYLAGTVAYGHLKSIPLAYTYFDKCAKQHHMGCMNVMANARLTGEGDQEIDILQAVDLHVRVYNTGTRYNCAGYFSAEAIGLIAHFFGKQFVNEDSLIWFDRARSLAEKLAKNEANKDFCGGESVYIEEYLVRRDGGEKRDALLQRLIGKGSRSEVARTTARYILGEIDDANLSKMLSRQDSVTRCEMHFWAAWIAKINADKERAQAHFKALLEIGSDDCGVELAYLKNYGH